MAELSRELESVDEQEYYTEGKSEEEVEKGRYIPPTLPRPRKEAGAFRVILHYNVDLDLTEYFTESDEEEEDDMKRPWKCKQPMSLDQVWSPEV